MGQNNDLLLQFKFWGMAAVFISRGDDIEIEPFLVLRNDFYYAKMVT